MNLKAVIFDLDGVIVTTDDCHYRAWQQMADEEGIPFNRTINERLRGVSRMESLAIVLEQAKKAYSGPQKQEMAERKNRYYVELIRNLSPQDILPGVMKVLNALKRAGVKTAIGSSSKNAPLILMQVGLDFTFDAVVCGNDIQKSKPDPEVFLLAAQKLGVAPQDCLVVEDADAGIAAAKAAGMLSLGVGLAANHRQTDFAAASLQDPTVLNILNGQVQPMTAVSANSSRVSVR